MKPYGFYRLVHREQKDERVPRRVEVFQNRNVLPLDAIISTGFVNSSCTASMPHLTNKLHTTGIIYLLHSCYYDA